MRASNLPFAECSFIGGRIKMAQTTFFDALPANAEQRAATAPAKLPAPMLDSLPARWIKTVDRWFHDYGMREREAYLAQSQDVFELEDRIRRLQRHPYY